MFKKYVKKQVSLLKDVTQENIEYFKKYHELVDEGAKVSISQADLQNGSPRIGDKIAKNPVNEMDRWLVAEQFVKDNYVEVE